MPQKTDKYVTLIITSISSFVSASMFSSINVALPIIGREFSMAAALLGWIVTSFSLITAALQLPMGRLADILGRRKIFLAGTAVIAVSSFLCAIAGSPALLIAFRFLQGVGAAMVFTNALAIITSVFPVEERGRAIGVNVASVYIGLSAGPVLGGLLTEQFGWRSIFYLNSILTFIMIFLVMWKLKGEWADAEKEKFDLVGTIIFVISITAILYGFTVITTPTGIISILLGLAGIFIFIRWEARAASPIIHLSLFKNNPVFVVANLAIFIQYCSVMASSFFLSLYLQYVMGHSPQATGLVLAIQPVMMVLLSLIAGRLSERIMPQKITLTGMVICFIGLLLLTFLRENTALAFVIVCMVLLGTGFGLFTAPTSNAVMGSVAKKYLGVASGMMGSIRNIGIMLSLAIATVLLSAFVGDNQITPEFYPALLSSMRVSFIIFSAICLAGIFLQFFSLTRHHRQR